MTIKELFDKAENGTLTFEQFEALAKEGKAKFADLSEGNYVSISKHNSELEQLNNQVQALNDTIKTRDTDLQGLQTKLAEAGTNAEQLTALSKEFEGLKTKYDDDIKQYKAQLRKQSYEFAVREFANSKDFTSNAAKRDFINSMMAKELKMDGNVILGADDFVKAYSVDNADAFKVETEEVEPTVPKPTFINPTPGEPAKEDSAGGFRFSFMPQQS